MATKKKSPNGDKIDSSATSASESPDEIVACKGDDKKPVEGELVDSLSAKASPNISNLLGKAIINSVFYAMPLGGLWKAVFDELIENKSTNKAKELGIDAKSIDDFKNKIQNLVDERDNLIKERDSAKQQLDESEEQNRNTINSYEDKLKEKEKELVKKFELMGLLQQLGDRAIKFIDGGSFYEKFNNNVAPCDTFVMSLDIRRSTELMLKAKSAKDFEIFITGLCQNLENIIKNNYGVFDKFTGDGILAYYPGFYSGDDAGRLVIKSAIECHGFVKKYFKQNRERLISVLYETGLGIGVDYGQTHITKMQNYTVIGTPVVYACRLSGAQPGQTLLNQQAYTEIYSKYKDDFSFEEIPFEIKNESKILAYKLLDFEKTIKCSPPKWDTIN